MCTLYMNQEKPLQIAFPCCFSRAHPGAFGRSGKGEGGRIAFSARASSHVSHSCDADRFLPAGPFAYMELWIRRTPAIEWKRAKSFT